MSATFPVPSTSTRRRPGAAGIVLGLAMVTTGLIAGVYYSYACSVMLGLARTDDHTFIAAMQQINDAIQNPVFFASFFGAFVLTAAAVVAQWRLGRREVMPWVVFALVLYLVGLLLTMGVNVPLNDKLAAAGDPGHIANPAAVREGFERPWVAWNIVRAVVSTAALSCLGRALALHGRLQAAR